MSATGTTRTNQRPYSIAAGTIHPSLRGLGSAVAADPQLYVPTQIQDYGIETRRAALDRSMQEARNQAYDDQSAARQWQERQQVIEMAQRAVDKAQITQTNILTSGSNSFRKLLFTGGSIATLSLIAVVLVAMTAKPEKRRGSGRSGRGHKSRSRRAPRARRKAKSSASWASRSKAKPSSTSLPALSAPSGGGISIQ